MTDEQVLEVAAAAGWALEERVDGTGWTWVHDPAGVRLPAIWYLERGQAIRYMRDDLARQGSIVRQAAGE